MELPKVTSQRSEPSGSNGGGLEKMGGFHDGWCLKLMSKGPVVLCFLAVFFETFKSEHEHVSTCGVFGVLFGGDLEHW
jgi:hypothetical protein